MPKPPTLSEMRHALADNASVVTSDRKGKKKRGSGDFDESKVRRDGKGQFSKTGSRNTQNSELDPETGLPIVNSPYVGLNKENPRMADLKKEQPAPTTVAGYRKMFNDIPVAQWGGGDVGISHKMPDGRRVWLYGDTVSKNNGFVNSTALVQTGGKMHVSNGGKQLLPKGGADPTDPKRKLLYWIDGVKQGPTRNTLVVSSMQMSVGKESAWDFRKTRPEQSRQAIVKVDRQGNLNFVKWKGWGPVPQKNNPHLATDFEQVSPNHYTYGKVTHDIKLADGSYLTTTSQNWDDPFENHMNSNGSLKYRDWAPIIGSSSTSSKIKHDLLDSLSPFPERRSPMPNPPTLSEMRHALGAVDRFIPKSDSGKDSKKGRGGGDFDEAKVKRDGSGKFATKSAAKLNTDDLPTRADQIDAEWKKNIGRDEDLNNALYSDKGALMTKVDAKIAEIKKRTGIDATKLDTITAKTAPIATELFKYIASEGNKILAKSPAAVSPSKTQRVQLRIVNPGTPQIDYKYVFVDMPGIKHSNMPTLSEMSSYFDDSGEVLEHFGIKGMRWGFRRTDAQLDAARRTNPNDSASEPLGSSQSSGGSHGGTDHVSADAERLLQTLQKAPSEMSTRELKEANARVEALKKYNELFNPASGANAALQAQVAQMKLQKEFVTLKRDLTPPSALSKVLGLTQSGFKQFESLDKAFSGKLSASVSRQFGLDPPMSLLDRLKAESDLANVKTANIKAKAEYNQILALQGALAAGDAASKAEGYTGAGKRSARTGYVGDDAGVYFPKRKQT